MVKAKNNVKFPEFILEKEFQCHNTVLVKDVVCKTIQKFVKDPQDVRLSITVSFQPHVTTDASHEQEAIAVIQVDKPGNFYPGGQEQRNRDKELEVLRQAESAKQKERREMRRLAREEEERNRRKMEHGVKRPGGVNANGTERMTRVAPPLPFKAELRRLPSGEMYAVREWIYDRVRPKLEPVASTPKSLAAPVSPVHEDEEKPRIREFRQPSMEEMDAIREAGQLRDDITDRDGSSLEPIDILSYMDLSHSLKTTYVALPSDSKIETKVDHISKSEHHHYANSRIHKKGQIRIRNRLLRIVEY